MSKRKKQVKDFLHTETKFPKIQPPSRLVEWVAKWRMTNLQAALCLIIGYIGCGVDLYLYFFHHGTNNPMLFCLFAALVVLGHLKLDDVLLREKK